MFVYFPVKRADGTAAGSVRAEQGRTVLTLSQPTASDCWLFSDTTPQPIAPDTPAICGAPKALLGVQNGKVVLFGTAPGVTVTAGELYASLSRNYPKKTEVKEKYAAKTGLSLGKIEKAGAIYSQEEEAPAPEPDAQSEPVLDDNSPLSAPNMTEMTEDSPMIARAKAVYAALEALHPQSYTIKDEPKKVHSGTSSAVNAVQNEDSIEKGGTDALLRVSGSESTPRGIDLFPRVFPGASWQFVAQDGMLPHFEGIWQHGGERIRILAVRGAYGPTPPPGLSGFTRYLRSDGAGYWVRLLPLGRPR